MSLTKVLGQVAAIIRSTTAPQNTNLIWVDTTTTPAIHKIYDGSDWIAVAGDALGLIRMAPSDTPDYFINKIDENTLEVKNNKLYVKGTSGGGSSGSGIVVYFVDNYGAIGNISDPKVGDEAFIPNPSDASKVMGFKFNGNNWFLFSDSTWENPSAISWNSITDADNIVEDLVDSWIGFGQDGSKILSSKEVGAVDFITNDETLSTITIENCSLINFYFTASSMSSNGILRIGKPDGSFPVGKILIINILQDETTYADIRFSYNKTDGYGFLGIENFPKAIITPTNNSLYVSAGDVLVVERFNTENLYGSWRIISYFEKQKTAHNKDFGLSVDNIVPIGADLTPELHVKLNSHGKLVPSNVFVDRGDSPYDVAGASIIKDNKYHNIDLSSIVPSYAKFILLRINVQGAVGARIDVLGVNAPTSNNGNRASVVVQNATVSATQDCWVMTNNQTIKYIATTSVNNVFITVGGWI